MIDTLCFSGGGVNALSFIGAFKNLINNKKLDITNIKNFIGTSMGGIILFFLSIGYDINELYDFCIIFNFNILFKSKKIINNIIKDKCLKSHDKIISLFKSMLYNKYSIDDCTFEELHKLTNNNLMLIGCNYSLCKEEIFSYKNTPDMSVITALTITMSIPCIFKPVLYNSNYYIDGCIVNNYPINHCDKKKTFGLFIENNTDNTGNIDNIFDLVYGTIKIIKSRLSENNNNDDHNNISIVLTNSVKVNMASNNITNDNIQHLLNIGYEQAENFEIKNLEKSLNKYTQTDYR